MTHTTAETLASKLRIIQTMRSILAQPPSEGLLAKIEEVRQADDHSSPTLSAFLGLLASGSSRNRDIAYTLLTDMQESLAAEAEAPPAVVERVEPSADPSSVMLVELPPASTVEVELPSTVEPLDLIAISSQSAASTIQPFHREGFQEAIPVRYQDHPEGEVAERVYSLIAANTTAEMFDDHQLVAVTAVVMGVRDQLVVEHGFGFTLLLGAAGLPLDVSGGQPWRLPVRMGYPSALPSFGGNEAVGLNGCDSFLAMHALMRLGYKFLVELEITPVNGRFLLSMSPKVLVERNGEDGQVMPVDSAHLTQLQFAIAQLAFVGFLANEEIHHD